MTDSLRVDHRNGWGARLVEVVIAAGLGFVLARTWPGTRKLERRLKKRGGARRLCPVCKGNHKRE